MTKNNKLLILINSLSFFCSHRLPIAEASKKEGYDVVIGYGELGGVDPTTLQKRGYKLYHIPMKRGGFNLFKDIKTLFYIWNFFKIERPNIVHLVTIKPYLFGGIISRFTKINCTVSAVSGLGSLFLNNNLKSKIILLLLYPIYKVVFNHHNQKIIFQNRDDVNFFLKWGVLDINKVQIIKGSGVKLENFTELKEQEGIPVVCLASRLLKDKGVHDFVSAARIIKKKNIQVRFCIAGALDSSNPSRLSNAEIKQIEEEGFVEILGYHEDIPSLFSKSHIICLPSYREGLPKTLIEAAAASRAVVTTDVPGCRDAIIPYKTGLLVPVKNPQKLADAIQWLIENPQKRVEMGKVGREHAAKEFTLEKTVQDHLDIYKELIQNLL